MHVSNESEQEKRRERYRKWYDRNKETARSMKRENMRRYRAEKPEHHRAVSRKAKRKQREKLYDAYGKQCVLCGFSDERALSLDHIKNNGAEERKAIGDRAVYYRALIPENKSDYRMLCMNCQFIERHKAGRINQHTAVVELAWRTLNDL